MISANGVPLGFSPNLDPYKLFVSEEVHGTQRREKDEPRRRGFLYTWLNKS